MELKYLIDSNAVIDYLGEKLPATGMAFMNDIIDAVPNISIITKIEVLGFKAPEEHRKTLTNFMNDSIILDLDNAIANKSIDIRKTNKIKLPDAIIAATALTNSLVLITRNTPDFKNIEGLQVINPYEV